MNTLSVDLASHDGHIGCIGASGVAALRVIGRTNETELVPLLDEVLRDASWAKPDIQMIACNVGPGGFTSVRNGVAFVNALADGLDVPLAGYRGSALALARTGAEWWFHSTKTDALFALGGNWSEPTLITMDALPENISTVAGDLLPEHRDALASRGATFPEPASLETALPAFLANREPKKEPLIPWYGRGI